MVLVITVVIMIILASVSVSLFTSGDGMYNNADTAVIEYKTKSIIEVIRAADMYLDQNNRFDRTKKKLIRELMEKVAEISEINEKNKDYIIDIRDEEQSATIIDKKTGVAVEIIIDENDRVIIETTVIDNIKDIEKMTAPKVDATISPEAPEKVKVVTITIAATEENKGIAKIKFPDGTEKEYSNAKTVTTEPYEVRANGDYRFVVVGANGRQAIKIVRITNVKEAVVEEIDLSTLIGAYVNYDAGNWTQADFDKITSSPSEVKPRVTKSKNTPSVGSGNGVFYGFEEGQSRNTNSTPYQNYIPVGEGWRIWDINSETGSIILISAGHPETFSYKYELGKYTGPICAEMLKKRDCSMYENGFAQLGKAHILTGEEVADWYNKVYGTEYTVKEGGGTTNSTLYGVTFETEGPIELLDNGSHYWLATYYHPQGLYSFVPYGRCVYANDARRLRSSNSYSTSNRIDS